MFYIIEIQTQADGSSAHIMKTAQNRNEAEGKYHGILQYAATSKVYIHSAAILTEEGVNIKNECYRHDAEE